MSTGTERPGDDRDFGLDDGIDSQFTEATVLDDDGMSLPDPVLKWAESDLEERLGLKAGQFTDTNPKFTFTLGAIFFGILFALAKGASFHVAAVTDILLERGPIPFVIMFLFCWSLAILLVKSMKLGVQTRALNHTVVPQAEDFVLAPGTAHIVLGRLRELVDDPKQFVLMNRVEVAVSNLGNIGQVSDVSEMLTVQAENDESQMYSSFTLLKGFVWAIPVLGFIGTVLGLSNAIGNFGGVLAESAEISALTDALREVTAGLSVAFDTTLLGLVAALFLQLVFTWQSKREDDFLQACKDYCHANIMGKLRLVSGEPHYTGSSEGLQ